MYSIDEIKAICAQYGIRPNKLRGQNFLIEEDVIERTIAEAALDKNDTVLEVGPGLGVLTEALLQKVRRVVAVESDKKLADFLRVRFIGAQNLEIVNENILHFDVNDYFSTKGLPAQAGGSASGGKNYKIVSNLPYSITSHFLNIFLSLQNNKPTELVLMLQKEVAVRVAAPPGEMSMLSLMAQFYAEAKVAFIVGNDCFWPQPEVASAVIVIKPKTKLPEIDIKKFFWLARLGFAARRKQLHNNLAAGLQVKNQEIKAILSNLGFDELIRAQDLSVEDWLKIMEKVNLLSIK